MRWPFSQLAGRTVSHTETGKTEKMQVYLRLVNTELEVTTKHANTDIQK